MDKYIYLLLSLLLCTPLISILLTRHDLSTKVIKIGTLGGATGLVAELFYFRDYWRPPSLLGVATISFEDFIFGFAITALGFSAYVWLLKAKFTQQVYPSRGKLYAWFFVIGFAAMLLFNLALGINSIFVTSIMFVLFTAAMLFMRRDLIKVGLYSTLVATAFIVAIYLLLFNIISPDYWHKYWLLYDTKWDVTILGNVPLTEILWYASWILFAGISYPFISGKAIHHTKKDRTH